jgi:hypothetical protein
MPLFLKTHEFGKGAHEKDSDQTGDFDIYHACLASPREPLINPVRPELVEGHSL